MWGMTKVIIAIVIWPWLCPASHINTWGKRPVWQHDRGPDNMFRRIGKTRWTSLAVATTPTSYKQTTELKSPLVHPVREEKGCMRGAIMQLKMRSQLEQENAPLRKNVNSKPRRHSTINRCTWRRLPVFSFFLSLWTDVSPDEYVWLPSKYHGELQQPSSMRLNRRSASLRQRFW